MFRSRWLGFRSSAPALRTPGNMNQFREKVRKTEVIVRKRFEESRLAKLNKKDREEITDRLVLQAYRELEEEARERNDIMLNSERKTSSK